MLQKDEVGVSEAGLRGGSLVLHTAWMPDETLHNRTPGKDIFSAYNNFSRSDSLKGSNSN